VPDSGNVLDTATILVANVPSTHGFVSVPVSFNQTSGTQYAIVLLSNTASPNYYDWICSAGTGTYSGGGMFQNGSFSDTFASFQSLSGWDQNFKTFVAVPNPTNCTRTITGSSGPVAVSSGELVCINGATVNGGVGNNGGGLRITGAHITGNIGSTGAFEFTMCGSTTRTVSVTNSDGPVLIGDFANDEGQNCNGNNIAGNVNVKNNSSMAELGGNTIQYNVAYDLNVYSYAVPTDSVHEIEGNTVGNILECHGNSPDPDNDGHPNTAATKTGECVGL
jgi:hypothetical protein